MDSIRRLRSYLSLLFSCSLESNGYVFVSSSCLNVFLYIPSLSFCFHSFIYLFLQDIMVMISKSCLSSVDLSLSFAPFKSLRSFKRSICLYSVWLLLAMLLASILDIISLSLIPSTTSLAHYFGPLLSLITLLASLTLVRLSPLLPILLDPFYLIFLNISCFCELASFHHHRPPSFHQCRDLPASDLPRIYNKANQKLLSLEVVGSIPASVIFFFFFFFFFGSNLL